jgi:hypothetical protein
VLVLGQPAVATGLVTVEGTVKTITMENKVSGYIVTKIKVRISAPLTCSPDRWPVSKHSSAKLSYNQELRVKHHQGDARFGGSLEVESATEMPSYVGSGENLFI